LPRHNKITSKLFRERRGVGAIIGGVILAAILLTTVMVYFITILNNEKAKTSYEMISSEVTQDKAEETFLISRAHEIDGNTDRISIRVSNNGSISLIASKILVYCISAGCVNPDPTDTSVTPPPPITAIPPVPITLNAAEAVSVQVGPVFDALTYRIEVVSERGNIVAANECMVNLTLNICENDSIGGEEEEENPCATCPITEGIIQGTGYVQLDFRAFGSIYSNLGDRAGVNQRGWLVETASPYGTVTGYPAFEIMFSPSNGAGVAHYPITFVEKMRNLDLYNETLTLTRSSSLLTNIGKEQSNQVDIEFICNATKTFSATGAPTGGSLLGYEETSRPTILPWTPLDAESTEGWQEVFFCTSTPGSGTANYAPRNTFNSFHPLFIVLRGTYEPSHMDYGQTIPYQSALPGGASMDTFEACLRASNTLSSTCPGPDTNCSTSSCGAINHDLVYEADLGTMTGPGKSVWIRVDAVTSPITVSWIYPDGNQIVLDMENGLPARDQTLVGGYVPSAVELPNDVTCDPSIGAQSYILKISDQYDDNGRRNVYYMTWRVTC
jgi:archaellum component FlaF (FlaF/FlaG flagellin family)